ncbi:MAG: Mur ligase family protein [Bacteroidota bacterium]
MRIHLIAMGGSVMHNLSIALHINHHTVSGSDDEIYNPARDRLARYGLLPDKMGWDPKRISADIDCILLGMHARKDNPELLRAQELGLKIYSYPAFVYEMAKDKLRVVVAGSHGKTTTTSMIMQVLKQADMDFDYLVGAQLEGFDTMVQLSDAPIMVLEGDEYLSSPIDRRPKILHYQPQISILTGIAWDHINVFPSYANYVEQFAIFLKGIAPGARLYYCETDSEVQGLVDQFAQHLNGQAYSEFPAEIKAGKTFLKGSNGQSYPIAVFGRHNLQNIQAAYWVCKELGVEEASFFEAMAHFTGAAKRLQILAQSETNIAFLDFAHAPSKVKATIAALKEQYPEARLRACLELHTFSSLNKAFLPEYHHSMQAADEAIVYFSEHTLEIKRLPALVPSDIIQAFEHPNMQVFTDRQAMVDYLDTARWTHTNLLMMTSGTFDQMDMKGASQRWLNGELSA